MNSSSIKPSSAKKTIIISAGGTGGHIFPALAVAAELSANYRIIWVGAKQGLENRLVPANGYPLETVSVGGVRNKGLVRKINLPFTMLRAMTQCLWILLKYRPAAVVGFGGYATFPIGLAARLTGRTLVIHEQNSVAGLTNKLLATIAQRVLTAFPKVLPSQKTLLVGNPVRKEIVQLSSARITEQSPDEASSVVSRTGLRILIVGGSLGAKALNDAVPLAIIEQPGLVSQVTHQVGAKGNLEQVASVYQAHQIAAEVVPFIEDMAAAYAAADLVICRAGASTVAEIASAGLAAIFVPYPYAVDDHQTSNAQYLTQAGAAILLAQAELTNGKLAGLLSELNPTKCYAMGRVAARLAINDSTEQICSAINSLTTS